MAAEQQTNQISPWCVWTLDAGSASLLEWSTGGEIATAESIIDDCRRRLLGEPYGSQIYCLILFLIQKKGEQSIITNKKKSICFFEILPEGQWRQIDSSVDVSALNWKMTGPTAIS